MTEYKPMQQLPETAGYKAGDVLVLAGELFGRGYANGLVDEAKRLGMTVIGTTVGRRDPDGTLRPLTSDELADSEALRIGKRLLELGGQFILSHGGLPCGSIWIETKWGKQRLFSSPARIRVPEVTRGTSIDHHEVGDSKRWCVLDRSL